MVDNVDKKYNDEVFKLIIGSSMWVYLTHDFWQAIVITCFF